MLLHFGIQIGATALQNCLSLSLNNVLKYKMESLKYSQHLKQRSQIFRNAQISRNIDFYKSKDSVGEKEKKKILKFQMLSLMPSIYKTIP